MRSRRLLPLVLVGASAACGGASTPAAAAPSQVAITGGTTLMWRLSTPDVRAGAVGIVVTSAGQIHDFVLDGIRGGTTGPLYPGQTVRLHVTLAAGTYHFHCTYHPRMVGTLVVR